MSASRTSVRFICFPLTEPPPTFASSIVDLFREHVSEIGTAARDKNLTSDQVLSVLSPGLV